MHVVTGEWRRPSGLIFRLDRLYMIEYYDFEWEDEYGMIEPGAEPFEGFSQEIGRRIFVLSPAGDILQTCTRLGRLAAGDRLNGDMAIFDCKLVVFTVESHTLISLHGV